MTAKPSPRPWTASRGFAGFISGPDGNYVAKVNTPRIKRGTGPGHLDFVTRNANAAIIVQAVNSFDDLVAVIREVEWNMVVFEDACDKCEPDGNEEQCQFCFAHRHDGHKNNCRLVAALRKAGAL